MSDQKPAKKQLQAASPQGLERFYSGKTDVDHDLFKLELAPMLKQTGYNDHDPHIEDVQHSHFFHSVDSNGKKQTKCAAVGGHFHSVKVQYTPDGKVAMDANGKLLVTVGPAVRAAKKKSRGITQNIEVPIQIGMGPNSEIDTHTHEVTYVRSESVKSCQR